MYALSHQLERNETDLRSASALRTHTCTDTADLLDSLGITCMPCANYFSKFRFFFL